MYVLISLSFTYTENIKGDTRETPLLSLFHSNFASLIIVLIFLSSKESFIDSFYYIQVIRCFNFHINFLCGTSSNVLFKSKYMQSAVPFLVLCPPFLNNTSVWGRRCPVAMTGSSSWRTLQN